MFLFFIPNTWCTSVTLVTFHAGQIVIGKILERFKTKCFHILNMLRLVKLTKYDFGISTVRCIIYRFHFDRKLVISILLLVVDEIESMPIQKTYSACLCLDWKTIEIILKMIKFFGLYIFFHNTYFSSDK